MPADHTRYVEQRRVPWWWWAVALLVAVPSVEVVTVFSPGGTSHRGWPVAVAALVATVAVIAAATLALSRSRIRVDDHGLWVDGESLPAHAVGRVRALDTEQARLVLGRDAHVSARLSIKPWLHRAVQIEVADPADPTPYWVVATRHPDALVAALQGTRGAGGVARLDAGASGDDGDHRTSDLTGAEFRAGVEKGQR